MASKLFHAHGQLCAAHPWEVIVGALTLTACAASVERSRVRATIHGTPTPHASADPTDAVVMTAVRCVALLYAYYQYRNLHKLGSKYILGIAGLFTVLASFIFTSVLIHLIWEDEADLKDAALLLLPLSDLRRAAKLARHAAAAARAGRLRAGLAAALAAAGPPATLDALLDALLVGVGALSGVARLERLCAFACLAVLVNYAVFVAFYPACLSLIMELSSGNSKGLFLQPMQDGDQDHKTNPVLQRVKIIMSAGLLMVHARSRWSWKNDDDEITLGDGYAHFAPSNRTEDTIIDSYIKWFSISVDNIVILILLCALAIKFIFFDDKEDYVDGICDSPEHSRKPSIAAMDETEEITNSLANIEMVPKNRPIFTLSDISYEEKGTQTVTSSSDEAEIEMYATSQTPQTEKRSLQECLEIYRSDSGATDLNDKEVMMLVEQSHIPLYKLESALDNPLRGVRIRRKFVGEKYGCSKALEELPYLNFDYSKVLNACCENVLGYVGIPVGYAGPLVVNGVSYMVPMATTEGALVASTNRGAKAIGPRGVTAVVEDVGMTRAPAVQFPNVLLANDARKWLQEKENFDVIKEAFDATSRFARLQEIHIGVDGPRLYMRFRATTGDAMGMNMVSKGAEVAIRLMKKQFPDMEVISLSGNYCSDKKPAAINWIKGRGKQVICEAIVSAENLKKIFRTDAKTLVRCCKSKNLMGSALAGSIGGNNAHAANMVTALFIATGQDPAQNVTSSNCSTSMELTGENGDDLYMTCTMPSLEVGTIGGGTVLGAQGACLSILGVKGAGEWPAANAARLAAIVGSAVLAGELSLMAALVNDDLVKSHMRHNRSSANMSNGSAPIVVERRISLVPPSIGFS